MLLNNEKNGLLLMPRPQMFIKSSSRSLFIGGSSEGLISEGNGQPPGVGAFEQIMRRI